MRILGIDPGTGILGFGVIEQGKRDAKLVDAGVIRTPVHQPLAERLVTIHDELAELMDMHKPDAMSVEKLFFCAERHHGYFGQSCPRRSAFTGTAARDSDF